VLVNIFLYCDIELPGAAGTVSFASPSALQSSLLQFPSSTAAVSSSSVAPQTISLQSPLTAEPSAIFAESHEFDSSSALENFPGAGDAGGGDRVLDGSEQVDGMMDFDSESLPQYDGAGDEEGDGEGGEENPETSGDANMQGDAATVGGGYDQFDLGDLEQHEQEGHLPEGYQVKT